jgi:hypothetical protein
MLIYPSDPPEPYPAPTTEEYYAFYSLLGRTVATWQMIESMLFFIFVELTRPNSLGGSVRALSAAFHTTPSFRGRLDMTNAAAREAMSVEVLAEWEKLYKRAIKRANRRNTLAHSIVAFHPFATPPLERLYIRPHFLDAKRTVPLEINIKDVIRAKELAEMASSFETLQEQLLRFYLDHVKPPEAPQQASHEQ